MELDWQKYIGIKVSDIKFRYSNADFSFNKEEKTISKGIASIKFMNATCANDLYRLRNNNYENFWKLLCDINTKTCTNSKQLGILIDLDFFSEFGNANKLHEYIKMYDLLNGGNAKSVSYLKVSKLFNANYNKIISIINKYGNNKRKDGTEKLSYTITNMSELISEIIRDIEIIDIPDRTMKEKISAQQEYLGYVNIATGDVNDKYKLIITSKPKPMVGKTGGIFAYAFSAKSIWSGKDSNLNIKPEVLMKNIFKEGDIINVEKINANNKGYWYVWNYKILE